jgi:cytoskeletal protein CcmA (bactofilin family)
MPHRLPLPMTMVRSSTDRIIHMKPERHRKRIHQRGSATYLRGSDMRRLFLVLAIGLASPALGSDPSVSRVLGSIDIAADRTVGDVSTVNGAIEIGPHASVAAVATVNGHLRLGAGAKADSMTTVNGSVTLEAAAQVKGAVTTVNGHLELAPGADVGGDLGNVNGDVTVNGAHVAGRLRTSTGSIETIHGAHIDGGILVDDDEHTWWGLFGSGRPRIVIGPGSVIGGTLKFDRKVKLYVSDRAVLTGTIEGAVPTKYSGDKAPD